MKVAIVSILFASTSAFASVCYQPETAVSRAFPTQLCMDSAQITKTALGAQLVITGGDLAGTYAGSVVASTKGRGVYQLTAKKNLVDIEEPSCGDAQIVDVILKVVFDESTTKFSSKQIEVRVEEQTSTDVCHSQMQSEEVSYRPVHVHGSAK